MWSVLWLSLVLEMRKGERTLKELEVWGIAQTCPELILNADIYSLLQCFGFLCFCRHLVASFHFVLKKESAKHKPNQTKFLSE